MSISDTTEKRFESDIHAAMLQEGYTVNTDEYDAKSALWPDTLIRFVKATQPKEWHRFEMQNSAATEDKFIRAFMNAVEMDGVLSVLRKGFKHRGTAFRVCYQEHDSIFAGECKYYDKPVPADVYFDLKKKCERVSEFRGKRIVYGIFSKSGYEQRLLDAAKENPDLFLFDQGERIL